MSLQATHCSFFLLLAAVYDDLTYVQVIFSPQVFGLFSKNHLNTADLYKSKQIKVKTMGYSEINTNSTNHSKYTHKYTNTYDSKVSQMASVTVFLVQDGLQLPELPPTLQTPPWLCTAVPLQYWQSDNTRSAAVLPTLHTTQTGNLAKPQNE